jgi:hypothetical protein
MSKRLLEAAIADPDRPISRIDIMPAPEGDPSPTLALRLHPYP